jgi:hypothetical protein
MWAMAYAQAHIQISQNHLRREVQRSMEILLSILNMLLPMVLKSCAMIRIGISIGCSLDNRNKAIRYLASRIFLQNGTLQYLQLIKVRRPIYYIY